MDSVVQQLLELIKAETIRCSLMEVCGTHTMAIARSGIRGVLPPTSVFYQVRAVLFV